MIKHHALFLVLLFAALAATVPHPAAADPAGVSARRQPLPGRDGLSVSVPAGWRLVNEAPTYYVRESELVQCVFIPLDPSSQVRDALSVMRTVWAIAKQEYPDVVAERVARAKDGSLVTMDVRFTNQKGTPSQAFYLVAVKGGRGLIAGYEAPAQLYARKRQALQNVLMSLHGGAPDAATPATKRAPARHALIDLPLVQRSTSDGSASVMAPADWQVQGAGTSMRVSTGAGEAVGAVIDGFQAVTGRGLYSGLIVAPYASGGACVANVYLPAAGATDIRVLTEWPATDYVQRTAPEYARYGVSVEASYVLVDFTRNGNTERGYFLMATTSPVRDMSGVGVWTGYAQGIWAPRAQFDSWGPLLMKIAGSFHISGQYTAGVVAAQWADIRRRLGEISRTVNETTEIVNRGYNDRQKIEQRRYDQSQRYAAGEEGYRAPGDDRIYMMPENYETWRQNPRTGEWMTTVSADEWNRLPVDRSLLVP